MITEIDLNTLTRQRDCRQDPQVDMVLAAVAAGNSRARFWQIGAGAYLLWDLANNVFYLAGEPLADDAAPEMAEWVMDGLRRLATAERRPRFGLRILHPEWENRLPRLFRGVALVERRKLFYRLGTQPSPVPQHRAGPDVRIVEIDAALLARADIEGVPGLRAEIEWMWPSLERFCQYGLGSAALKDDQILCWCTSEYLSASLCGIGIETAQEYERQGLATAVSGALIARARARGLCPYWECDGQNQASIRVAEKAGFELVQTCPVWYGRFA